MNTIKKNTIFIVIAMMAVMFTVSCDKEEDELKTMTVSPTSVSIVKEEGSSNVTITSNTAQPAVSSACWCTLTPANTDAGRVMLKSKI